MRFNSDLEPMKRSVFEAERDDTLALAVLHQQVEGEVLDEVVAVVPVRNETLLSTMLSNK